MIPQPFAFGKRLTDGLDLDLAFATPIWSYSAPLTALVSGTRLTSPKLSSTINNLVAGSAGAGLTLPVALPGKVVLLFNNAENECRVFADDPSTIDGASGETGALFPPKALTIFTAQGVRKWTSATIPFTNTLVKSYISAFSTAIQLNLDAGNANVMTFDTVGLSSFISIVDGSKITFARGGVYNLQFSTQIDKTDSGRDSVEIWLRKNGADVVWTNTWIQADNNDAKVVAAWNFMFQVNAGDFMELAWWSADTSLRLFARAAQAAVPGVSPALPAIPSVILTVQNV